MRLASVVSRTSVSFVCLRATAMLLLLLLVASGALRSQTTVSSSNTDANSAPGSATALRPHTVAEYGRLPLRFEANAGQTDPRVRFVSRGPGYTLFLTSHEVVLSLSRPIGKEALNGGKTASTEAARQAAESPTSVQLELIGASRKPAISPENELATKSNYFIGNDPTKWRANVPNYGRVRYGGIYPGIDLVYYGNQRQLEHDFVVSPGADPARIAFSVSGAMRLHIDADGDLALETRGGLLRLLKPVIYQKINGERREVAGKYVLRAGNRVGFEVAAFDRQEPLVIDPVLSYSTYLGGFGDSANSIAVDSSGCAYISGSVNSTDTNNSSYFPLVNPEQSSLQDGASAFVSKMSADGSSLVYSTFLGGGVTGTSVIAVDAGGSAYVTGSTTSANFPTVNAFQSTLQGSASAFITKFSADGSSLVYSTYLGGPTGGASAAITEATGIAVDSGGSAYVTGTTSATDFPTLNAFQSDCPLINNYGSAGSNPACSGFVTKLSPGGSSLVYSSYLHGLVLSNPGWYDTAVTPVAIAVDSAGSAYLTGSTTAPMLPGAQNGIQSNCVLSIVFEDPYVQCFQYAFVSKFSENGSSLVYSTYLGGSNITSGNVGGTAGAAIAVDAVGDAYLAGTTLASDFPIVNAFQPSTTAGQTAFVSKLNAGGSALVYSTYLGGSVVSYGSEATSASAVAVDSNGSAYVTGNTNASDFPTANAIQGICPDCTYPGGGGFVTELSADGSSLVYSTYLGGTGGRTYMNGIAVDAGGDTYVTGSTGEADFPVTPGSFQTTYGTGGPFITKIAPGQLTPVLSWQEPSGPIVYGTMLDSILDAQATDGSTTVAGSFAYTATAQGGSAVPVTSTTILGVGTYTLSAAFTPLNTFLYLTPANASITLQVSQATPVIDWASPAAIPYGTALSATQLNASSTVEGSFAYSPAAGTILGVGSQTLSVTFTPADTTDFTTAMASVMLVVNPPPPPSPPFGDLEGAVDSVTHSTTVPQTDSLQVSGWVADATDGAPLGNVKVYIDGILIGTPTLGIARPDVAAAYNNAAYTNSGYQLLYSAATLSLGTHAVTVVAIDSGGRSTTLGPVTITVT